MFYRIYLINSNRQFVFDFSNIQLIDLANITGQERKIQRIPATPHTGCDALK